MQILLLRHGSADSDAPRDWDRSLSAAGREELHRVLGRCRDFLSDVDQVYVSPYLRTQQTFEVAASYLPITASEGAQTVDWLTPNGNPQQVIRTIGEQVAQRMLLITHQPLVGTLLDELCAFEPAQYRMGTAALAAIEVEPVARGLGSLLWLRHP